MGQRANFDFDSPVYLLDSIIQYHNHTSLKGARTKQTHAWRSGYIQTIRDLELTICRRMVLRILDPVRFLVARLRNW